MAGRGKRRRKGEEIQQAIISWNSLGRDSVGRRRKRRKQTR